jgi:hypothetical protein
MAYFKGRWCPRVKDTHYGSKKAKLHFCLKCNTKFRSNEFRLCVKCRRENELFGRCGGSPTKLHLGKIFQK